MTEPKAPDNWQPERDRRVLHQAVQYEFLRQTVAELRKRIAELEEEIEKDGKELAAGFRVRHSYLDKIEQLEKALTAERQRREELEAKLAWDRFASEDTP